MSKRTLTFAAGIALGSPALLSALPIYVEYDGHLGECGYLCEPWYEPGQRVSGWLRIDTDRAPPGVFWAGPDQQQHAFWANGADFIDGTGRPGRFGGDEVGVIDDSERFGHQSFQSNRRRRHDPSLEYLLERPSR